MSAGKRFAALFQWSWPPTLIEWLVVMVIIAVLLVLLLTPAQWAADGTIRVPMRVVVFDAVHGRPIVGARVRVFHGGHLFNTPSLTQDLSQLEWGIWVGLPDELDSRTNADGAVVITQQFNTSSNNERPEPKALLGSKWVVVQAEGFGGVVVPVRHETIPTATLRKQGELFVPIGLLPKE